MNPLLQRVFDRRGYTPEFLTHIMDTSHTELLHAKEMAAMLHYYKQDEITILTDFDADGVLSGTLGFAGLSEMGFRVNLYTPDPNDGHEWNHVVIDKLMNQYPNTKVLLTCDSGIACYDGIARAKEYGIIVLVTDHHPQTGESTLADIVVNPSQKGDTYAHKGICGCHVLYQVLELYARTYLSFAMVSQIERLRLLVGVATVTDIMPIYYESREMVVDAITLTGMIRSDEFSSWLWGCPSYVNVFLGFQTILHKLSELGKLYDTDEQFFGWTLGPMLNTPKRMGLNTSSIFTLFLSSEQEKRDAAFDDLLFMNEQRKDMVAREYLAMKESYQPYAPLIYFSDAAPGVLGLLASKAAEESGLPAFVVKRYADGSCTGSGRSPLWLSIHQTVKAIGIPKFHVAGHDGAFGVSFPESLASDLYDKLSLYISGIWGSLSDEEKGTSYDLIVGNGSDADVGYDLEALTAFHECTLDFKPFGKGFPAPSILLMIDSDTPIVWKRIGSENKHLKGSIHGVFDILLWNQGHLEIEKLSEIKISGNLSKSTFRDATSLNLVGSVI